jgi:hypothetical protein
LIAAGCGETGPSELLLPVTVTNVTGLTLQGPAGEPLSERIVVRVDDLSGNPLPGFAVTFSPSPAGAGAGVDPVHAVTDARGEARTRWTLARTPGPQTLTAFTSGDASVVISATAGSPLIASLAVSAGNNQSGTAGGALPTSPSVIARDADGAPVEGVTVFFSVLSGGGSVAQPSAVTMLGVSAGERVEVCW